MYKEKLPDNCPPKSALENESMILYRIFQNNKLDSTEFIPYVKRYPNDLRFQKDCKAFAVSFFVSYDFALSKYEELLRKAKSLGNFIAKLKIPPKIGKVKVSNKTGHCSLWFYDSCDINNDIECIEIVPL
jgi:hypothetical protein